MGDANTHQPNRPGPGDNYAAEHTPWARGRTSALSAAREPAQRISVTSVAPGPRVQIGIPSDLFVNHSSWRMASPYALGRSARGGGWGYVNNLRHASRRSCDLCQGRNFLGTTAPTLAPRPAGAGRAHPRGQRGAHGYRAFDGMRRSFQYGSGQSGTGTCCASRFRKPRSSYSASTSS
jgi:hypothetical protein